MTQSLPEPWKLKGRELLGQQDTCAPVLGTACAKAKLHPLRKMRPVHVFRASDRDVSLEMQEEPTPQSWNRISQV